MTRFLLDTGIAADYINRRRGVYEGTYTLPRGPLSPNSSKVVVTAIVAPCDLSASTLLLTSLPLPRSERPE
jgi:hypothetical protein